MTWREFAACLDEDPELFFPHESSVRQEREAKAVCRTCPVVDVCLSAALSYRGRVAGIWGATTEQEREGLKRRLRRRVPV